VSGSRRPRSGEDGPAACTGAASSMTIAPPSKQARSNLLVFIRCRRRFDWLNSSIKGSVLNLELIVYSFHHMSGLL
jgi:hypothetical protein